MKKVAEFMNMAQVVTARIYRDMEWDEYLVKMYKHHGPGRVSVFNYHTADREDAFDTANMWKEQRV